MEIKENHISCSKNYRYFTIGNIEKATVVLYALHGYGQLGPFFSRKFVGLSDKFFVVIPEGMHRFYLEGTSGRVGASWMTKEDRESDIQDNIQWLNELDHTICSRKAFDKKIVLGFSQGGATAARWNAKGSVEADELILWASVYPPDLNPERDLNNKGVTKHHFVVGDEDEYLPLGAQAEVIKSFKEKGFETHQYKGRHAIDVPTLEEILNYKIEKAK